MKEVYPEYGYLLSSGFISHTRGKVFVRSGLQDLRLGVHKARGVKTRSLELTDCYLAHYHVRDVSEFLDRLHDRIYGGSYGRSSDLDPTSLRAGLEELMRKEGSDGLRKFFLTTCTANNQLLLRLSQKGLLLRRKVH
ncbi:hypothetical protein [Mesobacterium pallidum]|uniref:hypothetical protein n=1 Tax=Mesobacterium pallidum TaxID=2872037 RepID=UPI001EE27317|nr:hypothetical protein [Mesobacterium pallidum]